MSLFSLILFSHVNKSSSVEGLGQFHDALFCRRRARLGPSAERNAGSTAVVYYYYYAVSQHALILLMNGMRIGLQLMNRNRS